MFFFEQLKKTFSKVFDTLSSSVSKLTNKVFSKNENLFNFEAVKVYNHNDFSYVLIDVNKINFLSEDEIEYLLSYIIEAIKKHIITKESILINIITKIVLKDKLNINYTHSLTYKSLFRLNDLSQWKIYLSKDIKELLNHYNDSQLTKIEFRFDYITSTDLK